MTRNRADIEWIAASDYRSLIGETGWHRLHPDVQRRFSIDNAHRAVTYEGVMAEVFLSPAGRLLAQLCRLIGTPLALHSGVEVPMEVRVYPDRKRGGMTWERLYHYPDKPLGRVRSTKCIRSDLGLVELVGCGFGMQLAVYEQQRAIVFESTRFFWECGRLRLRIPNLLTPGRTIVKQKALADGAFRFSLDVDHRLLGKVFRQVGVFESSQGGQDFIPG